jgi:hypothetical protein
MEGQDPITMCVPISLNDKDTLGWMKIALGVLWHNLRERKINKQNS